MTSSTLSFAHLRELKELFPMLTVCACVSDAEESRNGPRYCAQDKFTKVMYEMRCLRVDLPHDTEDSRAVLTRQQRRMDALLKASQRPDLPVGVSLPIDVYMQKLDFTNDFFMVSVSPFTGLSLGDVIRSGWRLLEERDFDDILKCVEEYGLVSPRLPPHCNLNLNAVMRELIARPGAVELSHTSRWVIGDWDLLVSEEPPKPAEVISDIEWLLFSAFSKLNVAGDADGALFRREKIEARIMETVECVRSGLSGCALPPRSLRRRSHVADAKSPSPPRAAKLELSKAVVMHQTKLREEQQLLLDYRRRLQSAAAGGPGSGPGSSGSDSDVFVADDGGARGRAARVRGAVPACGAIAALAALQDAGGEDWRVALLETVADATELRVHRAQRDRAAQEQSRRAQRDGLRVTLLRAALMGAQHRRSSPPAVGHINDESPMHAARNARGNDNHNNNGNFSARRNSNNNGIASARANVSRNNNGIASARGNVNRNNNGNASARGNGHGNNNGNGSARGSDNSNNNARRGGDRPVSYAVHSSPTVTDDDTSHGVTIQVSCSPLPSLRNTFVTPVDEQRRPHTARREASAATQQGAVVRSLSPLTGRTPRVRLTGYTSPPQTFPRDARTIVRNVRRQIFAHTQKSRKASTLQYGIQGPAEKPTSLSTQHRSSEGVRRSRSVSSAHIGSSSALHGRVNPSKDSLSFRRWKIVGGYDANA